jgi:hypothetical protein
MALVAANTKIYFKRRFWLLIAVLIAFLVYLIVTGAFTPAPQMSSGSTDEKRALDALALLATRDDERIPGYRRDHFGSGWGTADNGCDMRNVILNRDLRDVRLGEATNERRDGACLVLSGILDDPLTGQTIYFERGRNSNAIHIDHVVSLSDGWQSGMHERERAERVQFFNDPLNLLAVDGPANMAKSDYAADRWLPSNRAFHCMFVARQISIKFRYTLSVTHAERQAKERVLQQCPDERILR